MDAAGQVLRHLPRVDDVDAGLFQRKSEALKVLVVVQLGAVLQATSPGVDRCDRVGRRLLALLVLSFERGKQGISMKILTCSGRIKLPVVSGDGTVGSLGFDGLAIWAD